MLYYTYLRREPGMSSIVKHKDKNTGTVYCYESVSYWDKDLKQPRSHRKLIGKIDPVTGEIVPTGAKGRPRKENSRPEPRQDAGKPAVASPDMAQVLSEKNREIKELRAENRRLGREKDEIIRRLRDICSLFPGSAPEK